MYDLHTRGQPQPHSGPLRGEGTRDNSTWQWPVRQSSLNIIHRTSLLSLLNTTYNVPTYIKRLLAGGTEVAPCGRLQTMSLFRQHLAHGHRLPKHCLDTRNEPGEAEAFLPLALEAAQLLPQRHDANAWSTRETYLMLLVRERYCIYGIYTVPCVSAMI